MVSPTPFRAAEFKSNYGPKYSFQPNVMGYNGKQLFRVAVRSASYGGAAGIALLFYASGIPRVQTDILQKVPFIGNYFIKEINPADNPF
ncbi:hypothetical protein N3K66_000372 [Trichothecium roseum]|uniref:Uncharacterized protein n=1 Tax=Trichothecium roseum TaxID=47278 RepID=A0ACC0VDK0_9HYPO|nr:hypothetical protein N3K66_000372 [Trichothecium roseum]